MLKVDGIIDREGDSKEIHRIVFTVLIVRKPNVFTYNDVSCRIESGHVGKTQLTFLLQYHQQRQEKHIFHPAGSTVNNYIYP